MMRRMRRGAAEEREERGVWVVLLPRMGEDLGAMGRKAETRRGRVGAAVVGLGAVDGGSQGGGVQADGWMRRLRRARRRRKRRRARVAARAGGGEGRRRRARPCRLPLWIRSRWVWCSQGISMGTAL